VAGTLITLLLFGLARSDAMARGVAEEANRAKSQFLATMSHELRTPLNAIGGYTELLEFGVQGPVNDGQREYLTRIKRAQEHLLGLINDVLNFARLEAGRVEIHVADVPLDEVLADTEELIVPQTRAKGIAYRREPHDPAVTVRADRQKVQQILLNLLSNATKFTASGGEIRLGYTRGDGTVDVAVADSGIGIPADRLEAIFDPFVQLNPNLTNSSHGVGLGLAISRELARSMGGDLVARSIPDQGATFTLQLPEGESQDGERTSRPRAAADSSAPQTSNPGDKLGER
jgi:signal transduction histidine kinase